MRIITITLVGALATLANAQNLLGVRTSSIKPDDRVAAAYPGPKAEGEVGVVARLKDIARFRGVRSNQLVGTGLILGLDGTGDSKKIGATTSALVNYLRRQNLDVDPKSIEPKNIALVMVTAELPPFATNGQKIDVTITSIGDAKSLRNGTLLITELKAPTDPSTVYAVASGAVSVGGFGVSQNGNSQVKGFLTVGRIPGGGMVEKGAATVVLHDGNRMFLELDDPDATTASRTQDRINTVAPGFHANAINSGTIEITIPAGVSATAAMARLEDISITTDQQALIVVNEKTGTIVLGGTIKIAPVAFMYGSLTIKVEESQFISQPAPFSIAGTTVKGAQTAAGAKDDTVKVGVTSPNTTVADLAAIFQKLNLTAGDVIAILQGLHQQGALKARVVLQ